jgi:hypothetical protein
MLMSTSCSGAAPCRCCCCCCRSCVRRASSTKPWLPGGRMSATTTVMSSLQPWILSATCARRSAAAAAAVPRRTSHARRGCSESQMPSDATIRRAPSGGRATCVWGRRRPRPGRCVQAGLLRGARPAAGLPGLGGGAQVCPPGWAARLAGQPAWLGSPPGWAARLAGQPAWLGSTRAHLHDVGVSQHPAAGRVVAHGARHGEARRPDAQRSQAVLAGRCRASEAGVGARHGGPGCRGRRRGCWERLGAAGCWAGAALPGQCQ